MKNIENEKTILNIIKYAPILFVLIISVLITQLFLYERNNSFDKSLKDIENRFLKDNEERVKEEVNRVYRLIEKEKAKSEEKLRVEIKNRVYEAHQIATNLYLNESTVHSDGYIHSKEHIFQTIKSALGGIIYNQGRGYFFIDDINGTKLLQPLNKEFEGKNLLNYEDAKGYQYVKKIVDTIINKTETFDSYYWFKGKDTTTAYKKISFYKYFEPFNVAIGTGEYIEDYENELKNQLLEKIKDIRFGKDGYIFIYDLKGNALSHYEKNLIGKNRIDYKNEEGHYIIKELVDFTKLNRDGFIKYNSTLNPNKSIEDKNKISYVKLFEDWNWIIGSGFYLDTLQSDVEKRKELLKESNKKAINKIVYLSIFITSIFIIISFYISRMIRNRFNNYKFEIEKEIQNTIEKEKLLIQQSKMATMGEMIGNIAHQWKQPLSVVSMSNGLLKLNKQFDSFSSEEVDSAINNIDNAVKNLSTTIDDFRNFFNPNKEQKQFNIEDAFDKTFKLIDSQFKNNNIEIIKNIEPIVLNTYENELLQALINILKNAKEELIKKDNKEKKLIFINTFKDEKKNRIIIQIKDNANGIPINIIEKIFDPYFTTKEKEGGTGIGLYMSKQIIENMNGVLEVLNVEYTFENTKYKGAQFQIILNLD